MSSHRSLTLAAAATVALAPLVVAASASPAVPVTCDGRPATIVGTDGKDQIIGTPGADVIHALKGFDTVDGRGGRDVICGGKGGDTLAGGPDADRLFGGVGGYVGDDEGSGVWYGNKLRGGLGDDYLSGGPDHDVDWPEGGSTPDQADFREATGPITVRSDGRVTGAGIGTDTLALDLELIVGTPYDDTMSTVGERSDLLGQAGDDSLRMTAGLVDVALQGGAGDDRLDGTEARKWTELYGGEDDDVLLGSPGADYVIPGRGNDTVEVGAGNDDVHGHGAGIEGVDSVRTGPGNDDVDVSLPAADGSTVDTGPGQDTLGAYWGTGEATVDATAGTFEAGDARADFTGTERYYMSGSGYLDYDAIFRGSDAAEAVKIEEPYIRSVDLRLGGGDDRVRLYYSSPRSTYVDGADGDDTIVGSWKDDELLGGPGEDTIDGLRGRDHCVAEHVTNCES
jgi:Ca2+-binding RTX toxin-like protein